MLMSTLLPPEAHFIAGKIEDQFEVWNSRNLDNPHPATAAAGSEIINLCQEMILAFQTLQEGARKDLSDYLAALRDAAEKGDTHEKDQ